MMGGGKRLGFYANGEHIVPKLEVYGRIQSKKPPRRIIAKVPCCTEEGK